MYGNRWETDGSLGRGAMGEVLAARHRRLGYAAALKRVPDAPDAFEAELRAVATLDHPAIVQLHDAGTDPVPWLVMERAVSTLGPPASWVELRGTLRTLLDALAAAHSAGLLHLDVKPSNILVRADGSLALADFGLATPSGVTAHRGGSLPYMAPERFRTGPVGPRADLYSLGCVAWELATGRLPRLPVDAIEALEAAERPLPPFQPRIPVPAGLRAWISTLLSPDPDDRWAVAADAAWALEQLGEQTLVSTSGGDTEMGGAPTLPTMTTPMPSPVPRPVAAPSSVSGRAPLPEAWPVVRRRGRPSGVGLGLLGLLSVPFVGREAEKTVLWEALRSARPLVVLRGPAGVGKSRLAEELAHAAGVVGVRVLRSCPTEVDPTALVVLDGDARPPARPGERVVMTSRARRPLPDALDVPLEPLGPAETRVLLADWIGLDAPVVSDLADRCEGDVALALAMVRTGIAEGALVEEPEGLRAHAPLPLPERAVEISHPDLVRAAAAGRHFKGLEAVGAVLAEHGYVVASDAGFTWVSPAYRAWILARAPEDEVRAAHLEWAEKAEGPLARWDRGQHLLAGGELGRAVEELYYGAGFAIASGEMGSASRILADVRARVPRSDVLSHARLDRAMAMLGPTRLGCEGVFALNASAIEATRHRAGEEGWQHVHLSSLVGHAWLANIRRLPIVARDALEALAKAAPSLGTGYLREQGTLLLREGRPAEAYETFERCRELSVQHGRRHPELVAISMAAIARRHLGDPDAYEACLEARRILLGAGLDSGRADLEVAIGDAARWDGDFEEAERRYEAALQAMAGGEARGDLGFRVSRALLWRERGWLDRAAGELAACADLLTDEGPSWEASIALHWASVDALRGVEGARERGEAAALQLEALRHRDPDLTRSAALLGGAR